MSPPAPVDGSPPEPPAPVDGSPPEPMPVVPPAFVVPPELVLSPVLVAPPVPALSELHESMPASTSMTETIQNRRTLLPRLLSLLLVKTSPVLRLEGAELKLAIRGRRLNGRPRRGRDRRGRG